MFDAIAKLANATTDEDTRFALASALGRFNADLVDRAVALVVDKVVPPSLGWVAVHGYLARDTTRAAAWVAIAPHVGELVAMLTPADAADLVESAGGLCDVAERDAVASTLGPHVDGIPDGKRLLEHALARIDHCASHRAKDVAAALSP